MSDHDHPLPPPEPDKVEIGGVTFWGIISFAAVIAIVFGLSGYFWIARQSADEFFNTTYGESEYVKAMEIESTEKLSNIKNAMQSITDKNGINARGMHWEIPTAVVPATPANPTTSANPTTPSAPAN